MKKKFARHPVKPGNKVFKKQMIWVNIKSSPFDAQIPCVRWAISSVGERFLHTEEVAGSIPASPTNKINSHSAYIIKILGSST